MNVKRNFLNGWVCPVMVGITLILGLNTASADPVCDDDGGLSPWVCVDKSGADAEPGEDFTLGFNDPANPCVTLKTGNLGWQVWSQVSQSDATSANIGDIKIDATNSADVFEMSLLNETGGAGAANVGSIILNDATNWTGHSSITAGEITGDLAGDITVVKDASDNGGRLDNMKIGGDVAAASTIDVFELSNLEVVGDLEGDVFVTDRLPGTAFIIRGAVTSTGSITISGNGAVGIGGDIAGSVSLGTVSTVVNWPGDISGQITICDFIGYFEHFWILGNVEASAEITLKFLSNLNVAFVFGNGAGEQYFRGTLKLPNGIPSLGIVSFHSVLESDPGAGYQALIDFLGTDMQKKDLAGVLFLDAGGTGDIANINEISGAISSLGDGELVFGGTVTMVTLSGGIVTQSGSPLAGSIKVTGDVTETGIIHAGGDLDASIDVDGDMYGWIKSDDDMTGEILVGGLIVDNPNRVEIEIGGEYSGEICATNFPPAGDIEEVLTVGSLGTGATFCESEACFVEADCDDSNECTDDACVDYVCQYTNDDTNTCTDGNECTDDSCSGGVCFSVNDDTNTCTDGNQCTDDSCSGGVCFSVNDDTNTCTDGNQCTDDSCSAGVCTSTNEPLGTSCDDGLFCTATDECDGSGTCVGSGSPCAPRNPFCCESQSNCWSQPCT